jgi:hypothetical protein
VVHRLLDVSSGAEWFYLHGGAAGIEVVCGLTAVEVKSLMTSGHDKALHILVDAKRVYQRVQTIPFEMAPPGTGVIRDMNTPY